MHDLNWRVLHRTVGNGISFDFDEPIGVDETSHLHERRGRTDIPEELTVDFRHLLPIVDPSQENACSNHVRDVSSQPPKGVGDDLEASPCLRCYISRPHSEAVRREWSRP